MGFGVTLPSTLGGFPMRLRTSNFLLQQGLARLNHVKSYVGKRAFLSKQ